MRNLVKAAYTPINLPSKICRSYCDRITEEETPKYRQLSFTAVLATTAGVSYKTACFEDFVPGSWRTRVPFAVA